jgi:hypothetical protein
MYIIDTEENTVFSENTQDNIKIQNNVAIIKKWNVKNTWPNLLVLDKCQWKLKRTMAD